MRRLIKSADDLAWLLEHTGAFQGGQVTELHIQKQRLFDELSSREITMGTTITALIHYQVTVAGYAQRFAMTRVARLSMRGVTDFSVFEQEGADFSRIGTAHAEATAGQLRFWFDPCGELYVICEEAELEEVSLPTSTRPLRRGVRAWTYQAETEEHPTVAWFLTHLDQAGQPCVWRPANGPVAHPAVRWEGHFYPVDLDGSSHTAGVFFQAFGPLSGGGFGITLRVSPPHEDAQARLLESLADLITRHFPGSCLAGDLLLERDEWLNDPRVSLRRVGLDRM